MDPHTAGSWGPTLGALSFFLPTGEAYFINSVRYYLDRIDDPELKTQAQLFVYQEGAHAAEHSRANRMLKDLHPFGSRIERMSEAILGLSSRCMPRATQLATSCALEHFTAILADALLRKREHVRAVQDPAFAALWLWHAAEEIEHKAVCFDVYQHVCGKGPVAWLHRVLVMAATSLILVTVVAFGFAAMKPRHLKAVPQSRGYAARSPSVRALAREIPFMMYLDYYRASFHPWKQKNADLIEAWKVLYPELHAAIWKLGPLEGEQGVSEKA